MPAPVPPVHRVPGPGGPSPGRDPDDGRDDGRDRVRDDEGVHVLQDGAVTRTRRALAVDLPLVDALHDRCSPETRRQRYHGGRNRLSAAEWRLLCAPEHGLTFLTHPWDDPGRVVAVTHLMHVPVPRASGPRHPQNRGTVELALLIEDAWQSRGLGAVLTRRAVELAASAGHRLLTASVQADNRRTLALVAGVPHAVVTGTGLVRTVEVPLDASRATDTEPAGPGLG